MARGDIAYINLPSASGSRAQSGRRPGVLVISDTAPSGNPMIMVVPFTSNLAASRFPFTIRIAPSPRNGLAVESIALVFQLRAVDQTHVETVIGHLEEKYLTAIDQLMRQMLDL